MIKRSVSWKAGMIILKNVKKTGGLSFTYFMIKTTMTSLENTCLDHEVQRLASFSGLLCISTFMWDTFWYLRIIETEHNVVSVVWLLRKPLAGNLVETQSFEMGINLQTMSALSIYIIPKSFNWDRSVGNQYSDQFQNIPLGDQSCCHLKNVL